MKAKSEILIALAVLILFGACQQNGIKDKEQQTGNEQADTAGHRKQIAAMLDSLNLAAANAEYERYFNYFTEDAVFLGTDATEHWDKPAFMAWARPFFDNKKAWSFTAVDRHIYFGTHEDITWFDELLDAPFAKICRGSGVLVRQDGAWKVQHYVLSMTIPNEVSDTVRNIKAPVEDSLLNRLKGRKS